MTFFSLFFFLLWGGFGGVYSFPTRRSSDLPRGRAEGPRRLPVCRSGSEAAGVGHLSRRVIPGGWFQAKGVVAHRIVADGSIRSPGLRNTSSVPVRGETGRRGRSCAVKSRHGRASPSQERRAIACGKAFVVNLCDRSCSGSGSEIGSSARTHPVSGRRGGAHVAAAATEADHYTAAA